MAGHGTQMDKGSSPRMRGTLTVRVTYQANSGIIPAHAGNTIAKLSDSIIVRDHPRACGEHIIIMDKLAVEQGSSPRMRGTLG